MIHDFYFRFYKLTHSERISIILSYIAQSFYIGFFMIRKMVLKKEIVKMETERALEILQSISPDPQQFPDYSMMPVNEKIDLSIIVPIYNHVDVLKKCIDSVINQKTHYTFEVLLIDDGSTDGAQELIEKYSSDNVIIIHQENGGIAAARNTGICKSQGSYLMFVDCDDYIHDDLVECLLNRAKQEAADIVMCAHSLVKINNGKVISRLPNIYPSTNMMGYKNGDDMMNFPGLPWGKIYKRELFKNVRFFPGYWYEDTIIHSLIFTQCKKFVYVPEVKYEYMWHDSNFSHVQGAKNQNKAVDRYWLLRAIMKHYDEMGWVKDAKLYTMLLEHVSTYYYKNISSFPDEVIQAMFVVGKQLLLKHRPETKVRLPYLLRCTEKAFLNNDIALWKLCSMSQ